MLVKFSQYNKHEKDLILRCSTSPRHILKLHKHRDKTPFDRPNVILSNNFVISHR